VLRSSAIQAGEEINGRSPSLPPGQNELIEKMAAINKRVIVVITSGSAADMTRWVDRLLSSRSLVFRPGRRHGARANSCRRRESVRTPSYDLRPAMGR
jgi:hypothetical protein